MQITRYQDSSGKIGYAAKADDGTLRELDGQLFGDGQRTIGARKADVKKVLAPVAPPLFLCIGLADGP